MNVLVVPLIGANTQCKHHSYILAVLGLLFQLTVV